LLLLLAGCVSTGNNLEKRLIARRVQDHEGVLEHYQVGCPDVLRLSIDGQAAPSGDYVVGPEGRISLGEHGPIRVDGRTPPEIAQQIAITTGVAPDQVHVEVTKFRSQYVILLGQVIGWQRVVPYHGQETVLDLLQRTGGITRGAAPNDVHVVRMHMEEGRRPEVFRVDLSAILTKNDDKTNLRLMPFDQIYVGERRQCRVEKVLPPMLRPMYQMMWDTRPDQPQAKISVPKTRRPTLREMLTTTKLLGGVPDPKAPPTSR
jgi:protein involved in polysaccharide export with SLBB domain